MMNLKNAFSIFFRKISKSIFRNIFRLKIPSNYNPLYNYFHYTSTQPTKYALLSYRVYQLHEHANTTWSSSGDVHDIIQALSELGYKTDVIDLDDLTFRPIKNYDLFLGYQGKNFKQIYEMLPKKCIEIFCLATSYWKFQNDQEQKRFRDVIEKRHVSLHMERYLHTEEDFALTHADGRILLSNKQGADTYPEPNRIMRLVGASFTDKKYLIDLHKKNFAFAKNRFLFFSGSGNILKGLDLVLEAFKELPDKELFICTKLEKDFAQAYDEELFHTPNIHFIGYIKAYKKTFFDLMNTCEFIIFPSASEGSPGSVADCMTQGLIPLVSSTAHIDVESLGYLIEPCTTNTIKDLVNTVTSHEDQWYKDKSIKIRQEACDQFSQRKFIDTYKKYIQTIIEKTKK